jgi:hypothetical protein
MSEVTLYQCYGGAVSHERGTPVGGRVPPGAGAPARDRSPSSSLLPSSLELSETQVYEP